MRCVPFSISYYEGLAIAEGLLRLENDELIFEFMTRDGVFGLVKSELKKVPLLLEEVQSVEFRRGAFGSSLFVQSTSLEAVNSIPGQKQGRLKLAIARRDVDVAREFAELVKERIRLGGADPYAENFQFLDEQ